ncbi:MAG: DUF4258 domain-containing protein [Woeseia sp.]
MSRTLDDVKKLVAVGEVRISEHGYDEIADDHIFVQDIISGLEDAVVVEDYPTFGKGPAVPVLQYDREKSPIHAVWGVPKGRSTPAVLVTAYRPAPQRWSEDFLERRDGQT